MNYGQPGRIRLIDGKANFEMFSLFPAANIKGLTWCGPPLWE